MLLVSLLSKFRLLSMVVVLSPATKTVCSPKILSYISGIFSKNSQATNQANNIPIEGKNNQNIYSFNLNSPFFKTECCQTNSVQEFHFEKYRAHRKCIEERQENQFSARKLVLVLFSQRFLRLQVQN